MTGFGGTETVIKNLFSEYERMEPQYIELQLVSIGGYDDAEWVRKIAKKKVISLSRDENIRVWQYFFLLPVIMLFMLFSEGKNSVIVSTNPVIWTLAYIIKKIFFKKYKVVSWYHYSLSQKPINALLLHSADRYLAISSGIAEQLRKNGIDSKSIRTIFNPVLRNEHIVKRSSLNSSCQFLYVGRIMLDGQKSLRTIIDSLSGVAGRWNLILYGKGDIDEVWQYIRMKGLEGRIEFKGFDKNLWNKLENIDCLLLSSKYEGFPMVLNEAISVGIPVLSMNCDTGPKDIVNDENGVLIGNNDVKVFKKHIQGFIDRLYDFKDVDKIKESISPFYSDNYFTVFLNSVM
ncbi:glycosyltransferase [Levilactobacillus brevis]|nr:glycosyltransferase [Levilactobacillus brevis]